MKSLTENQIYFASPNELNDPFDCNITVDYSELKSTFKIFEYATKIVVNAANKLDMTKEEMIKEIYRVAEIIQKEKASLQKMNDQFIIDKINDHIGIFSTSTICDNFLLWSHYGDSHKGFCIGYDVKGIRDTVGSSNGGHIQYCDEYPKISPINELELLTSWIQVNYKAECWAYEKEFRISKLFSQKRDEHNRVFSIPDNCIKEIILGTQICEANKQAIIEVGKTKNFKLYEMKRIPTTFNLKRVEV